MTLLLLLLGCAEVSQTPTCEEYVACLGARDEARGTTTDMLRFEAQGDCWGSPAGADLCDRACTNGLAWLQESETDLPEACSP
jgi:hypothetical protein